MKISLITAVYNNASGLRSSLESSLGQTHQDVERIVIDGGSTDGTLQVLQDYTSNIDHIVSEPDNGIYDALNKGIQLATGDIIGILHSDDLFAGWNILETIARKFESSSIDLLYGDLCYVSNDNPNEIVRYWRAGAFTQSKLPNGWMPPHPTVYVKRELFDKYGLYDTHYRIAADYDWMLRLLTKQTLDVAYFPEVLVHMRTGGASNRSFKNLWQKSREDYLILRNHQIGGVMTLVKKNTRKLSQFWKRPKYNKAYIN